LATGKDPPLKKSRKKRKKVHLMCALKKERKNFYVPTIHWSK